MRKALSILSQQNLQTQLSLSLYLSKYLLKLSTIMERRDKQLKTNWKPTSAQIRILEDAYQSGGALPTPEQIYRLTLRLLDHGIVEPGDVHVWFENRRRRRNSHEIAPTTIIPTASTPTSASAAAVIAHNPPIITHGFNITTTISSEYNVPLTLHTSGIVDHVSLQHHLRQIYTMVGHLHWLSRGGSRSSERANTGQRSTSNPSYPHRGEGFVPVLLEERALQLFPVNAGDISREMPQHGNNDTIDAVVNTNVDLRLRLGP